MTQATLIIPCYNEAKRLPAFLRDICLEAAQRENIQIIISDDGSEATNLREISALVKTMQTEFPFLSLMRASELNQGKGAAIAFAAKDIKSGIVGFVDADGAVSAKECLKILDAFLEEILTAEDRKIIAPAAAISRRASTGEPANIRTVIRAVSRHLFAGLVRQLFRLPIHDPQSGCKFFTAKALSEILPFATDRRWLWDTQIIILMHRAGLRITEYPVRWRDRQGSNISLLNDSLGMLWGLARFYRLLGH